MAGARCTGERASERLNPLPQSTKHIVTLFSIAPSLRGCQGNFAPGRLLLPPSHLPCVEIREKGHVFGHIRRFLRLQPVLPFSFFLRSPILPISTIKLAHRPVLIAHAGSSLVLFSLLPCMICFLYLLLSTMESPPLFGFSNCLPARSILFVQKTVLCPQLPRWWLCGTVQAGEQDYAVSGNKQGMRVGCEGEEVRYKYIRLKGKRSWRV